MKDVNTQILWTFELGTQKGENVPIWIIVGFQQRKRQDSRNLNNASFCRPPVLSDQCVSGTEKYPESAFLLNYDDDDYSQRYGQIKETFRAPTTTDILQPYIYQIMILDHLMKVMIFDILYTFSIYGIRKI